MAGHPLPSARGLVDLGANAGDCAAAAAALGGVKAPALGAALPDELGGSELGGTLRVADGVASGEAPADLLGAGRAVGLRVLAGDGVALAVALDVTVGLGPAYRVAPTYAGDANRRTGWPCSAWSMKVFQMLAGSVPPVTSLTPAIPCSGALPSRNSTLTAASCGV